jgi:hypothetical protein
MKALAKTALAVGSALTFFAVAGASTLTFPTYFVYYYSAATGLSLILAGLISFIN